MICSLAFHAAGTGHHGKVPAADLVPAHVHDGVVRVELAVGFLVRLGHAAACLHHRVGQHPAFGQGLGVADQAQDVGIAAHGIVDLVAHILQLVAEGVDLSAGACCFNTMIIMCLPFLYFLRQHRTIPALGNRSGSVVFFVQNADNTQSLSALKSSPCRISLAASALFSGIAFKFFWNGLATVASVRVFYRMMIV